MSGLGRKNQLFKQIESYLATAGFDQTDAKIYALALSKGKINSSIVSEEFPNIRQSTAIERLKSLARKGCLETIPKETAGRRPYAIEFKAINPRIALKEHLQKAKELPELLELYDEHWEALGENLSQDTEIWVSKSERVSARIGASILDGAKQEIRIYSHDCSWCKYSILQISLENATKRGVTIVIIADNFERTPKNVTKLPITLYLSKNNYGSPFCIVDEDWLILPVQNGTLLKKFLMIRTNDRYLINNFSELFKTALSYSSIWGKNNV